MNSLFCLSFLGFFTIVLTNPIWVVKTRLCLQYDALPGKKLHIDSKTHYRGIIDCAKKIVRNEGPLALYKVIVLSSIEDSCVKTCFSL